MNYQLLIFSVLLSTSLSSAEYGVLSNKADFENIITLEAGDVFEVFTMYSGPNAPFNDSKLIGVLSSTDDSLLIRGFNAGNESSQAWTSLESEFIFEKSFTNTIENADIKLVGPMKVFVTRRNNGSHWGYVNYKLTRAEENELGYKNINIVSLPSSAVGQGTHNIVVEASDDLQSWTPVHSSSIGGDKTFFRTRVVEAE